MDVYRILKFATMYLTAASISDDKEAQALFEQLKADPKGTFLADPRRILLVLRYVSKYDDAEFYEALEEAANDPEVKKAFRDTVTSSEVFKEAAGSEEDGEWKAGPLLGPNPDKVATLMKRLGLLDVFVPKDQELLAWDTEHENPHHKFSIWGHTIAVVSELARIAPESVKKDARRWLVLVLAALFHDIGKRGKNIRQPHKKNPGQMTYIGHAEESEKIVKSVLTDAGVPGDIIHDVVNLVSAHMHSHNEMKDKTILSLIDRLSSMPEGKQLLDEADAKIARVKSMLESHRMLTEADELGDDPSVIGDVEEINKRMTGMEPKYFGLWQQSQQKPVAPPPKPVPTGPTAQDIMAAGVKGKDIGVVKARMAAENIQDVPALNALIQQMRDAKQIAS